MLKRNDLISLIAILLLTMLAACGNGDEADERTEGQSSETEATEETADTDEEGAGVEVDKGLFQVEVTLPPMFFEGDEDIETMITNAEEEDGISDVTENEDGSITVRMSKAKHGELMDELETSVMETMDDIVADEEFGSIEEITSSSDYSEFTMVVAQEAFENSFDGFATLTLGMTGMLYQLFDGVASDDIHVEINIEDAETGEVFSTVNYPEALENME